MLRKTKIITGVLIAFLTVLAGSALALSTFSLTLGTVGSYNFVGVRPGHAVPAIVQIQAFTMKPGDTIPWHSHKAASYVILERGTLTEQHVDEFEHCVSEEVTAGSAFVEPPALVHTVSNTGNDVAVIWWATVFPKSDGIVQFTPAFKAGGVYPEDAPNCN